MQKKIIVYGATGGIGREIIRLLHAGGYPLHLVARNLEKLEALAAEVQAGHTAGDVTDPALFDRVAADCGDTDGLVYAVGTIRLRSLGRLSPEDFITDFRVNALGAALAIKASLPALRRSQSDPSVVLFSSVAARQGFSMHGSVGMAKGAVSGLTLSLAAELAPRIRVNAIAPSLTNTPLAAPMLSNETLARAIAASHALGRIGTAGDVAAAAVFLLSEDAAWVTGQILGIDGGLSTLRTRA